MNFKRNLAKNSFSHRIMGGGLLFLTNLSLVLTGFSSWSIGPLNNPEVNLDITTGKVIDINNYIKYGNADIFEFCKDGVIKDDTLVTTGDIIINFSIEVPTNEKISDHLPENTNSITIVTNFINKTDVPTVYNNYKDQILLKNANSSSYDLVPSNTDIFTSESFKAVFTIDSGFESNSLSFDIKYSFKNFPIGESFNTDFYQKINRNKIWFNFKAEVELA